MKFKIYSEGTTYCVPTQINLMKKFGFKFNRMDEHYENLYHKIHPNTKKWKWFRKIKDGSDVELNTLEELMDLCDKFSRYGGVTIADFHLTILDQ